MLNVDKRRATSSSNGGERMNESEREKATAWVEGDEGVASPQQSNFRCARVKTLARN